MSNDGADSEVSEDIDDAASSLSGDVSESEQIFRFTGAMLLCSVVYSLF